MGEVTYQSLSPSGSAGSTDAVTDGGVASRLIVTDCSVVPPALVAEHVKVTPVVSVVTDWSSHPVFEVIGPSSSLTVQVSATTPRYHPFRPEGPVAVRFGVMTGPVESAMYSSAPVAS